MYQDLAAFRDIHHFNVCTWLKNRFLSEVRCPFVMVGRQLLCSGLESHRPGRGGDRPYLGLGRHWRIIFLKVPGRDSDILFIVV